MPVINSLSGLDTLAQAAAAPPAVATSSLSSPTDRAYSGGASSGPSYAGTTAVSAGIPAFSHGARTTSGAASSTTGIGAMSTAASVVAGDPAYYFNGSMSEDVLHRYLDRAMEVDSLSHMWWDGPGTQGPEYRHDYDPSNPATFSALIDTEYNHGELLEMIVTTGAKLVYGLAGFRPPDSWYLDWICKTFTIDTNILHAHDPQIITGAGVPETLDPVFTNMLLPSSDIILKFYPAGRPVSTWDPPHTSIITDVDQTYFDYRLMMMDYHAGHNENNASHLDISQPETRMYYYYLCTRYIKCGCEHLHFGDLFEGCQRDPGNRYLWSLVKLIREYAVTNARRGLVLIGTHAGDDSDPAEDPYYAQYLYGWYYEPPFSTSPDWQKQLIFDFNMLGTYYRRNTARGCSDPYTGVLPDSVLPVLLKAGYGLINHSNCGLHPQGWYCSHLLVLNRLDSGGIPENTGCLSPLPADLPWVPDCYGYDNASWFARQTDGPSGEKDPILIYTYYKIKCLDPYSHFGMPGRTPHFYHESSGDGADTWYNALSEQTVITKIWNGTFANVQAWVHHNFTFENVSNGSADSQINSSLIFVDDNKMYFIADDGYIHGYIKVNDNYNGGTWLTVCPSFEADTPYWGQVKAKSSLVASPAGDVLLYIGVDGYIYGFDIVDVWTYHYFEFLKGDMISQGIWADSCLIYPTNIQVYYISGQHTDGNRVQGFQYSLGSWHTVSPSYGAASVPELGVYAVPISHQVQPAGALTYDALTGPPRLYYRGTDGYLYYFHVWDLVTYEYIYNFELNNVLYTQDLKIVGNLAIHNNRIYFVGLWTPDPSQLWVYCIIEYAEHSFGTVSPTWSAVGNGFPISNQLQPDRSGNIAVSPDGNTIAYFGLSINHVPGHPFLPPTVYVCYYYSTDGENYLFNIVPSAVGLTAAFGDALQFTSNTDLYCGSNSTGQIVHHFKWQEDYCNNPIIYPYEHLY